METLKLQDIYAILGEVTKVITDNSMHLCELDSVVGDGDHGTTIKRGVKAAQEKIEDEIVLKLHRRGILLNSVYYLRFF